MRVRVPQRIWLPIIFCGIFLGPFPSAAQDPITVIRFDDYQMGPVEDWLAGKGFAFEQDAKRRDRIDLDVGPRGLEISARRKAFGVLANEGLNLSEFSRVEIDWGVDRHPSGASYEQGVRNEAIMLMVFVGDEKMPSGSMFIPDAPHFIALFLCSDEDRIDHPYVGAYFKKSGRYVCTDRPALGEQVTSQYNLLDAYRRFFDKEKDDDPGVSGIALALDTKKASDGGLSAAFIREIRFYR